MTRALRLARRAEGRTAPNPMVGCVVVQSGQIVGEGWHPCAGDPHAEVFALRQAGERSRGADVFVTLEPCCHQGRTPPCTDALIEAGVKRVVAAMVDPFPKVAGGGLERLRAAGIQVDVGLFESESRALNRAYLKAVTDGLPWLTLKMAMTLDGRVATASGESRWVTGPAARQVVHRMRDRLDAVMVGGGTARRDNPALTARLPRARPPQRVIVASRGDLPEGGILLQTAREIPTLVAMTDAFPEQAQRLRGSGCRVLEFPAAADGAVPLESLCRRLVEFGVQSVLCEGGPQLAGGLLAAGLVDEVVWFLAPKLLNDAGAPGPLAGPGAPTMGEAWELESPRCRRVGEDWMIQGRPRRKRQ